MKKTNLVLIVLVNFVFYLPIIFSSLTFIEDDYVIFAYIKDNLSSPIITDPTAQFFLFMRPLSYMSFWIDYHLFTDNYIAMKLVNLVIHIVFIISLYKLLDKIREKYKLHSDSKVVLLISFVLSIHLDSQLWITFICNRTEQLMILFYTLSLFFFIKYTDTNKKSNLLLTGLFFLLSVLAKQTGLHLPLLILIIILYEHIVNKKKITDIKELSVFFILSALVIILSTIFNLMLYKSQVSFSDSYLKKPFTIFSILIHSIIPFYSNYIHNYFIMNKSIAVTLLLIVTSILSLLVILLIRKNKDYIPKILVAVAIFITILFPRIFAIGSQRINGIVLVWLCIAFLFAANFIRNKKNVYLFLITLFLLNGYSFYVKANDIIEGDKFKEKNFRNLVQYLNTAKGNTLVLCSDTYDVLPYKYHYYAKNTFGKSDRLFTTPIFYEPILVNHDLSLIKKKFLFVERKENKFIFESNDPLIYLLIYENDPDRNQYDILEKEFSGSGRGYKKIVMEISTELLKRFNNIIYFNGLEWVELK